MWLRVVFLLAVVVLGLSGNFGAIADCTTSRIVQTTNGCVLTFSPYMTPQIVPTTTYYEALLTTTYYVVDCDFCTVTNDINHNPVASGPWYESTHIPTLTVTRVACIPSGTATTRGVDPTTTSSLLWGEHNNVELVVAHTGEPNGLPGAPSRSELTSRSENGALLNLATVFSNDIPPDTSQLPGRAQQLLTSVWSAIFALNVADSGLNATWACAEVQTIEVKYQLKESWLDPDQVKAILCWIADHGYYFNTTRAELYSTLQAAVYALQVAGDFTSNRTAICEDLDLFYRVGGYLGINTHGFEEYACRNIPSETPSPSEYYGPTPVIPLIPYPVNSTTSWGHPTPWNPNTTIWPTGTLSPTHPTYTNRTSGATGGTGHTTPPRATGTGHSGPSNVTFPTPNGTGWSTSTISGTAPSSHQPPDTSTLNGSVPLHVPLDPNGKAFYPAVATTWREDRREWFKRY